MKKTMKILMTLVCAMLLVVSTVFGTLAYLTATTDEVKNTFTIGNNIAITLDEAKVGADGKALTGSDAARVKENSYKLFPGAELDKDPTVHVASTSDTAWLFVQVNNGLTTKSGDSVTSIEVQNDSSKPTIETQMGTLGWTKVTGTDNIWAKTSTVAANTDHKVFEHVYISSAVTDLTAYKDQTITIIAYAIQADGFGTYTDAWTALNGQLNIVTQGA